MDNQRPLVADYCKNIRMIVYQALYCGCIWESSYATLSLHMTQEGAERAVAFHKKEVMDEWEERYSELTDEEEKKMKREMFPWDFAQGWAVKEIQVLD